jgi:hypothetical protein
MAEATEDQVIDQEELEVDESSEETTDEEEVVESDEQEEEEEEEESEEEERKPSRRESLRIQQLVSKLKSKGVETNHLPEGLNYKDTLEADDETISKLEDDRKKYGDTRYSDGVKQAESIKFHTRLEIDAPQVASKYEILNKESSKFNPVVADALNTWYLQSAGYDEKTGNVTTSDIRYKDFIDGIMELSEEIANEKVVVAKKNIAKQAAKTGLRPTGGTAKRLNLNQDPGSMTNEELDAFLAQAIPPKK